MNKIVSSTGNGTVSAGPDPHLRTASPCVGQVGGGDHKCLKREGLVIKNHIKKQKDGLWKSLKIKSITNTFF